MRRWLGFAAIVACLVALSMGFSPTGTSSSTRTDAATTTGPPVTFFPTSRADPAQLAPHVAQSIVSLGSTRAGEPVSDEGHSHSDSVAAVQLDAVDATMFSSQWAAARAAIPAYDTQSEAAALGYMRATAPSGGIGTHWVLWPQIAEPFDPAVPSMLLFDERRDPAVLVGYSFALQSPTLPEGFAGTNDHWHQHRGLCVDNGWVVREQAAGPDACDGIYIAGGDFWMLHAWVVPGWENRKGEFAPFNPKLCPPNAGTPDVNRCPA